MQTPAGVTPVTVSDRLNLALAAAAAVLGMFVLWDSYERWAALDDASVHRIHLARGVTTSVAAALVVGVLAARQHRRHAASLEAEVRRRTSEAESASALLQLVVDNTPASLLLVDASRRVVQANRVAARVHGAEVLGRTCHEIRRGADGPCPGCSLWVDGRPTGAPPACPHTDPRTGEILTVESHPLRQADGREYVLLVEHVVTEQRKLQARLIHQEKMAAFGLLAAGIAHEMGNPLSSMEAQLQLLDPAALPAEPAGVVRVVREEVQRLRRILKEMVDFARRRRDEATLVSVQGVVRDALRLLRHEPRTRRVEVAESYDPDTPPVLMVEDHLMQVVLNLLMNALDAMPGGGTLRLEVRPVDERVVLRVRDSGAGMDRHVLAHCFEPLFTTKEPGRGTGLGLSITRDILRDGGGDVELHSAPGRGTTAVVTLPRAGEAALAATAPPDRRGAA